MTGPLDPLEDGQGFEARHVRFVIGCLFLLLGFAYSLVIIIRLFTQGEKPGFMDMGFMAVLIVSGLMLASTKVGIEVLDKILNKWGPKT